MKKTTAAVVAAALIITIAGTTVSAHNYCGQSYIPDTVTASVSDSVTNAVTELKSVVYNRYNQCNYCNTDGHCYTDADGDGICDHRNSDSVNVCPNYDGSAQCNKNCTGTGYHNSGSHCGGGNSRTQCRQGRR